MGGDLPWTRPPQSKRSREMEEKSKAEGVAVKTCQGKIKFGDDFHDNPCTFHCQREAGHVGHCFELGEWPERDVDDDGSVQPRNWKVEWWS